MATKSAGKKKPSASAGAPRSYSEVYKSSAASVTQTASAPAQTNGAASKSSGSAARTTVAAPAALITSDQVDWKGEYGYVLADLRYLGIVTLSLVVGIIVVGLFL